jgi:hypothetical protein
VLAEFLFLPCPIRAANASSAHFFISVFIRVISGFKLFFGQSRSLLRLGCCGNLLNHFARSPLWRTTLRRRRFLPPAPPRETSARRIFPLTEPRGTRRSFSISKPRRILVAEAGAAFDNSGCHPATTLEFFQNSATRPPPCLGASVRDLPSDQPH